MKKSESKSRLKRKERKALWLSGEMISEVKDKINVKNLRKKKTRRVKYSRRPVCLEWMIPH